MPAEEKKNGNGKTGNGMTCSCAGSMGCNCAHGCGCGCGGHGHRWTFFLLRTLLTILILMLVFWFGAVVGRMSSLARGEYMMRGYRTGAYNMGSGAAMPMIPVNGSTTVPVTNGVQNY